MKLGGVRGCKPLGEALGGVCHHGGPWTSSKEGLLLAVAGQKSFPSGIWSFLCVVVKLGRYEKQVNKAGAEEKKCYGVLVTER